MSDNGESKRPEPPSPEQYAELAKDAAQLQKSGLAGKARKPGADGLNSYARFTGIGVLFALVFGLPTLLGYWLDTRFGLLPWLTLAGAVLGAVSAMTLVVREVSRMDGPPKRPPAESKDKP
ncbi:MAG: AtpZ/AtpI family protein [Planctomycetes bacterium]|nr:AtpZ/AtpI family protein [Planctomycetota bacterium]